ncbi:helicase-related protein [Pseudomonadota bacterium]
MMIRDELVEALRRELIGPAPGLPFVQLSGEEVLAPEDPPRLRYGAGILFPSKAYVETQEDDDSASEGAPSGPGDDEDPESMERNLESTGESDPKSDKRGDTQVDNDLEVNRSNEFLPSAMGLTTLVDIPDILRVQVSAAQYEAKKSSENTVTRRNGKEAKPLHWLRIPLDQTIEIDRNDLLNPDPVIFQKELQTANNSTKLVLHIYSRSGSREDMRYGDNVRFLTVTLVNRTETSGYPRDEDCVYQCGLSLCGSMNENCFLPYPEKMSGQDSSLEEQSLKLLYRHRKVFSVGHGCASDWDVAEQGTDLSKRVWSSTLPTFEVKPILPRSLPGVDLGMAGLANGAPEIILESCHTLANQYENWIDSRIDESKNENLVPAELVDAALTNMQACRTCLHRIRRGIELLQNDPVVLHAFKLMNRSMVMQHEHYQLAADSKLKRKWTTSSTGLTPERLYAAPDYDASTRQWRPFQLAFILMTLRSIVTESEEDLTERNLVDLIWFPTGGGKTEAYLGLAAFTMFYRRLLNPRNSGTTVLMRYTLRLLTTQQFQRAASLICASEVLRRSDPESLGEEPITIGLWVGGGVTPNKEQAAVAALNRLLSGDKVNPFIVLSCPWCGVQMGPVKEGRRTRVKGYRRLNRPNRVRLICDDPDCEFNHEEGLPLRIIDEHIYSSPPTLVIGTVDKFAMMPWNPACRTLLGLGKESVTPPDLIIQDELHLISGPLGSMVGHYETVIDVLTERESQHGLIAAKIVASTATISRADDQVRRLYGGRESCLFPAQGLRAGDSFFAEENTQAEGRLYCGVFATGLPSLTTTQVRVLASLLQAPKTLGADDEEILDPYWTLMVYFNSIRELGHAATLIKADIPEYISVICRRLGLSRLWSEAAGEKRRWVNHDMELTSRVQNSEITEYMDRLFTRYPGSKGEWPVDVCLATNMIQVGLDVPRLSLMSIIGQPKTTSEYIQASSRVGRSVEGPGLVVTILSPSKPRDRSHIEHFRAFHESIYRHVEPTSVTPFALPVAERALHALIIALVRFWGSEAERGKPDPPPSTELEQRIRFTILERVNRVEPEEKARIEIVLDEIFAEWHRLPADIYGYFSDPLDAVPMMYPAGTHPKDAWDERAYPTPSSMRNVDASCIAAAISLYPE